MKRYTLLFLIISSFIFSKSVSNVSSSVNTSSSSSSSNSNYSTDSRGGYTENTQIVGVEELLDKTKFEPRSFSTWMSLYYQSRVIEAFLTLYKQDHIDENGVALDRIRFGSIVYSPGKVVIPSKLIPYFQEQFTSAQLFSVLKEASILDDQGFIIDFPEGDIFRHSDFNFLFEKIKIIDLGFNEKHLEDDLKRQLVEYLVSQQSVKKVTSVTTTDYQSREDTFLAQLGMQLAGAFIGKYLFKDKVNVEKQKTNWVPHLQPTQYLDDFYIGFNKYPYAYNSGSQWLWNGKTRRTVLDVDYLEDDSINQYLVAVKKQFLFPSKDVLGKFQKSHGYFQVFTRNHMLQDDLDDLSFYSLGIGLGGSITYKNSLDAGLGLAFQNGDDLSVGLMSFIEWEWFAFRPVSFSALFAGYQQPNQEGSNWSFSEQELRTNIYLPYSAIRVGYRRLGSGPDTLTHQIFGGLTISF